MHVLPRSSRTRRLAAIIATTTGLLAACGSDSPSNSASSATTAADAGTVDTLAPAAPDAGQDPAIVALLQLDKAGVCALIPPTDVEAIAGPIVGEPFGNNIEGLGTNCIYYGGADGFATLAKLEFQALNWTATAAIAAAEFGDTPVAEPCSVGGKDALCRPAYEAGGITIGASVYVKLGTDADYSMLAEADGGREQAAAIAELALTNLGI